MRFERILVLDWSSARGPKRGAASIWLAAASAAGVTAENIPTRAEAEARLMALAREALGAGGRLLLCADANLGWPRGFAARLTGRPEALAVWERLAAEISDDAQGESDHRAFAARANALFGGEGPFWGDGRKEPTPGLPRLKPPVPAGLAEKRQTEALTGAKSPWQMAGAGAVGAQGLTLAPILWRLRAAFSGRAALWPAESADAPFVIAEIYFALIAPEVKALLARSPGMIQDEAQTRAMAELLMRLSREGGLAGLFTADAPPEVLREEGWILGAGRAHLFRAPPPLRNDCFALPPGVDWEPVDKALERLLGLLKPVAPVESLPLLQARGRALAEDVAALRAHPPAANSAVDGYSFAHHSLIGEGPYALPLVEGRAAAGQPFRGAVPAGRAIRILTGAILPEGVDTVVLEEDCAIQAGAVAFHGPIKAKSNTRKAGEDMSAGDVILKAGRVLRAPDLATLAAAGHGSAQVYTPLKVAVLSTGDEIIPAGAPAEPHQTYDANRPMLMGLIEGWGHRALDLGHAPDSAAKIRARLDAGAREADAIIVSGGASAGDEDHVSRLLKAEGALSSWRIAMKPGRPLALAMWKGKPVFGLPGNAVAAFVCTLVFARPALGRLAGAEAAPPQAIMVPAAFSKRKKAGRREWLRARLNARGEAEVFISEGSGRVSGLTWATGLVEFSDAAESIAPGDPVRFLPYEAFGVR